MKRRFLFIYVLLTVSVTLSVRSAWSQPDLKKLFSENKEHRSIDPKFHFTGSDYYWLENDTLFECRFEKGTKIALRDIDFSKTTITASSYLVDQKNTPVYKLEMFPLNNKPVKGFRCFNGNPILSILPDPIASSIRLDMEDRKIASDARDYLRQVASAAPGSTNESAGNFDSQLYDLIMGLKDDFRSLQGKPAEENSFLSKVQLQGSVSTKIYVDGSGDRWLSAYFGEFSTRETANAVYNKVIQQVDSCKKNVVSMVKAKESISAPLTVQAYLPIDLDNILDASMKDFSVKVQLGENMKFDKNLDRTYSYIVTLLIEKD